MSEFPLKKASNTSLNFVSEKKNLYPSILVFFYCTIEVCVFILHARGQGKLTVMTNHILHSIFLNNRLVY